MAITSVRPSTPVSSTTGTPDKPAGTTPGNSTLPANTADTSPPPVDNSGAEMMQKVQEYMSTHSMNSFKATLDEAKKDDQEFEDEMKEEDSRNGVE